MIDLMRPAPDVWRCCICFEAVHVDDLYRDSEGDKWDMCVPCGQHEEETVEKNLRLAD